ncbi:MAG: trypsin-like peptidase domain-containing protein [Gammaproteobacteria bacterium]|nr:trypsin-like peptidase domain-containing protein [Gammaproteobacteria bacterium]
MRVTKLITFIIQFATIGLAAAFLILYFQSEKGKNETEQTTKPGTEIVELIESTRTVPDAPLASYAPSVKLASPAVVNIQTTKIITEKQHPLMNDPMFRQFFGDSIGEPRKRMESSLGSGVIVSPQGYILTNHHVIKAADEIMIALKDGRTAKATVIGTDPDTDLAVLHIKLKNLPAITLSKSNKIEVGDVVLAIGNPFGVGQTVTSGIVSATGRNMLGISTFENFIQTDAAINPGNSGGALINAYGELIGINTAIFSKSGGSQGIGFAIPLSLAKNVLTQIIEFGHVKRGWLGVAIQNMNAELANSFGMKQVFGVIINGVAEKGPADKAGLKPGDVITHINDTKVENTHHLLNLVSQVLPGNKIAVDGVNQDGKFSVKATVIQRPKQE